MPASAHAKVFYSLLAGSVTTALDALPGVVLSVLIIGASPIEALVFYALCIAIDLYSSSVMLFITLSLPSAISFQIKQVITIIFIYFGLLPIAAIIIIGAVLEMLLLFILLAALFAFFIGAVVYAFSPLFIENGRK